MFTCPANHSSETAEFCSVCGLEIATSAVPLPHAQSSASHSPASTATTEIKSSASGAVCPDCGAPRDHGQQIFCEVCGFNYASGKAGSGPPPLYVPVAESAQAEPPIVPVSQPIASEREIAKATAVAPSTVEWELVVTVDDNLFGTPNPDAPVGQPAQTFRLFDRETLIGRAGSEVRVQAPITGDHGVSRRHALVIVKPDDSLVLRDLNSANGTQVDGVDIVPGVDTPLHDGAVIGMGAWTSITVQAIK